MNIGLVTTWFDRGAGMVSRQIMKTLLPQHNVWIYARGEKYASDDPHWNLPNVHWGRRVHWPGPQRIDRSDFARWIASRRIETIIFNEQRWWQPVGWAKDLGITTGAYIDYYTPTTVPHFAAYDFLICNTERHHSVFQWHNGAHMVPWGTDTSLYKPTPSQTHNNSSPLRFFHSAGMSPHRKGTDILIEAFTDAARSINARLIIHTQTPLQSGLKKHPSIEIIHRTVPPPGLYSMGDVYVYPSRLDGLGLTVCEALSCGLPVITTDSPPMSEFVQHGQTGHLVEVARTFPRKDGYYWPVSEISKKALTEALIHAHTNRSALPTMKAQARAYACEHRDWKKNSAKLLDIVENATRRPLDADARRQIEEPATALERGLERMYESRIGNTVIQAVLKRYRRARQPHLYR